jgi:hypothetical protein
MKGLLSKLEYIVIGIFALIFLMWAISKCSSHKKQAQEDATIEAKQDSLDKTVQPATAIPKPVTATPQAQASQTGVSNQSLAVDSTKTAASPATKPAQPEKSQEVQQPQGSKLYVTIDKLKIRKTPGLKGELLGELKLFDEVYYQNEVTDSTYEVNLGKEMANEPYVKVKTKRGTVGWVYGAGVHYVKKKRSGVLE